MKNVKIKSIYLSNYKCFEKASIDCEKEDGTIYLSMDCIVRE